MSSEDILYQEKEKRRRTALLSEALRKENTYALIVFTRDNRSYFQSKDQPGHKLGRSKIRFRFEGQGRQRFIAFVYLYRVAFGQTVMLRKYQLSVPPPSGGNMVVDISLTAFPLVLSNYDKWASAKIQSQLRSPWTLKTGRKNPEFQEQILTQGWIEGGTVRSFSQQPYQSYLRQFSGTVTPGFRTLKKSQLPVNPYGLLLFRKDNYGEYVHNTLTDQSGQLLRNDQFWWDFSIPGGDLEPVFNTGLYNRAVKNLSSATQSNVTSNVALNLVQIQQTVNLIFGSATRITGALRAVKSGNFSQAAKILWRNQRARYGRNGGPKTGSSLAANWLELQYGWKPLLSDIRGSMEALARYNFANVVAQKVAASASFKSISETPIYTNDSAPTQVGSLFREQRDVCRFGIQYRLASPLTAFLAQTGFTNPVNLAWELLPFSFVVDWFLPIGPYLETIGQWDGLEFSGGFSTNFLRKRTIGRTYFSGKYKASDPGWNTDRYGAYSSLWVKHSRSRLTSFPSAHPPEFKHGLNVTRALNAVALLRVVFGK